MVSPQAVANSILYRAFDSNTKVTPMKLQKLLYFVYRDHLVRCNDKLFNEPFEVWPYGPVLPSVYHEFKSYRSKPVDRFSQDAQGNASFVNEKTAHEVKKSIDLVWIEYGDKSGIELSQMTHEIGTAWSHAYDKGETLLTDDYIREEGKQLATACR